MGRIRLGRIFGLETRIDYSWFVIVFLILWTFTMGLFPVNYTGLPAGVYIAMGAIGTLLCFVSILVHELSRSLVARRRGVPVEGITSLSSVGSPAPAPNSRTRGTSSSSPGSGRSPASWLRGSSA